jgi:hypothetical protein
MPELSIQASAIAVASLRRAVFRLLRLTAAWPVEVMQLNHAAVQAD